MSKKHHGAGPIPKGNQSNAGPKQHQQDVPDKNAKGAPASEQDPKRRLGGYETAGEHAIEQPGGKQGPNR
jgi:hypothetical protein